MGKQASNASNRAQRIATWAVRIAFAAVFVMNVACSVEFIAQPSAFVGAYELSGVAGNAAVQGIGIAFLMWNCTYPALIAALRRFPVLGWVILAQQLVGLVGESVLYWGLPTGHALLASSVLRFIVCDGAGLVLMASTWISLQLLLRKQPRS